MECRYKAFISYRHMSPDQEIADHGVFLIQDTDMNIRLISAEDGTETAFAEGLGEIFSCAVGEDRIYITYRNPVKNVPMSSGHEIYYDGTIRDTAV